MDQTEHVEVKLLKYTLILKKMRWQEHSAIEFSKNKDPMRVLLAHALVETSGIPIKSLEEATRVMEAIPYAFIERVFKIWRVSFPSARKFTTARLYAAPEPEKYILAAAKLRGGGYKGAVRATEDR